MQLRTVGAAEEVPVEGNGDPAGAYGDLIDGAAVLNGILEPGIVKGVFDKLGGDYRTACIFDIVVPAKQIVVGVLAYEVSGNKAH